MSSAPRSYLLHILMEADYLTGQVAALSREDFIADETLRRAFVRSLEVIGEAAKNVPDEFKRLHSDVDWKGMAGMRDRLIHGYAGVDYDLVWDVVTNNMPSLRQRIAAILG